LGDVIVVEATSISGTTGAPFHPPTWTRIRAGGGGDKNGDDFEASNGSNVSTTTGSVDEPSTASTTENEEVNMPPKEHNESEREKPRRYKNINRSPFRLLQEAREEVASLEHVIPDDVHNEDEQKSEDLQQPESKEEVPLENTNPRGTLVGGAVAVATQKGKNRDKRLIGAPASVGVDTSRVAPLSLRLLEENAASDSEEDEEEELVDAVVDAEKGLNSLQDKVPQDNMTHVAKLWWVNLWTQQLSEIDKSEVPTQDDMESGDESSSSPSETSDEVEAEEETEEEVLQELTLVPSEQQESLDEATRDIGIEVLESTPTDAVADGDGRSDFVSSGLVSIFVFMHVLIAAVDSIL